MMWKEHKYKVVLSSALILMPMVWGLALWDRLSSAGGSGAKLFAVFGLPGLLLVLHLGGLALTLLDQRGRGQNQKALRILFWIIPVCSLLAAAVFYWGMLDWEMGLERLFPGVMGVLFLPIGNYLPKIKQNRTLGIRLPWTLGNEENWNKTHRFGGKVWVAGGLLMIAAGCLPTSAGVAVLVAVIVGMSLLPILYSYRLYKHHRAEGISYAPQLKSRAEKVGAAVAAVVGAAVLAAVAVLMVTGDLTVFCGETSFQIQADYWSDLEVDYDDVDTISYREDFDPGTRANGFGSLRLAMGRFRTEELGAYTLYAYEKASAFVLLTSDGKTLAIGLRDPAETRALYETLSAQIER